MSVAPVTGATSTGVTSPGQSLAANFDNFLKLLTTQLQNQDPLAPMDANQFTSQLVQFASVEQAIQTNTRLGDLGTQIQAGSTATAMDMLGREITAATDVVGLPASGDATIRYRLPEAAAKVTVIILDDKGRAVGSAIGTGSVGDNLVHWNGSDGAGGRVASGGYKVRVDATRADGTAVAVDQYLTGTVDAIETGTDGIGLVVDGATVPISTVRSARAPESAG